MDYHFVMIKERLRFKNEAYIFDEAIGKDLVAKVKSYKGLYSEEGDTYRKMPRSFYNRRQGLEGDITINRDGYSQELEWDRTIIRLEGKEGKKKIVRRIGYSGIPKSKTSRFSIKKFIGKKVLIRRYRFYHPNPFTYYLRFKHFFVIWDLQTRKDINLPNILEMEGDKVYHSYSPLRFYPIEHLKS